MQSVNKASISVTGLVRHKCVVVMHVEHPPCNFIFHRDLRKGAGLELCQFLKGNKRKFDLFFLQILD